MRAEVLIVGAGIAGTTCATMLARRGRRVLLVDAAESAERAGASWINGVEQRVFHDLALPEPGPDVVFGRPLAFTMQSPGGKRVRLSPVPTWDIDMRGLQAWMLGLARRCGAEVRYGARVSEVIAHRRCVQGVVLTDGSELRAPLVVDAGGYAGPVRSKLPHGAWDDPEPEVAERDLCLAHQEVRQLADPQAARDFLAREGLFPTETLSHSGVAGGYSIVNVQVDPARGHASFLSGAKLDAKKTARKLIVDLAAQLGFVGPRIFGGGGKLPLRRAFDLLVGDGFALLGNAGCQVFPSHGSGVASGMRAAALLAEIADRAISAGDLSRAALWPYAARWQRGRGAVSAAHDVLRQLSETLTPSDIDRLVGSGLLGPGELWQSLACDAMTVDPASFLLRAPRLVRALPWAKKKMLPWALAARAVEKHYRTYPERWNEGELRAWQARAWRLFDPSLRAAA